METIVLEATIRDIFGKKLAKVRAEGQLPAVIYGNNKENQPLLLDAKSFGKAFAGAGHSTILDLKIGDQAPEGVLIHAVDIDPITNEIRHADLYRVNMNKTIRTEVPIHFVGESSAVFQDDGSLLKNIEEVEVETLPANLPSHLEVDISTLDDFSKTITIADLQVPQGVKILVDPEELICKVEPPRSEEEMAALDEEVGDAIPEGVAEEGEGESTDQDKAEDNNTTAGESKPKE